MNIIKIGIWKYKASIYHWVWHFYSRSCDVLVLLALVGNRHVPVTKWKRNVNLNISPEFPGGRSCDTFGPSCFIERNVYSHRYIPCSVIFETTKEERKYTVKFRSRSRNVFWQKVSLSVLVLRIRTDVSSIIECKHQNIVAMAWERHMQTRNHAQSTSTMYQRGNEKTMSKRTGKMAFQYQSTWYWSGKKLAAK